MSMSKTIQVVEDERNVRQLYKRDFHSWVADAFLTKSFDLAELKNTISKSKIFCTRKFAGSRRPMIWELKYTKRWKANDIEE